MPELLSRVPPAICFWPPCVSGKLLRLEVGIDVRAIDCRHPNLVALVRWFWRLPVLDELSSRVRLGRRTVRKGFAFPRFPFPFEAPPHESEAQPQVNSRVNGKAEPYRTVRRQSRRRSLTGTISGASFHTVRRPSRVEQLKVRKAACETESESKRKRRGRGSLSSSVWPGTVGLQIGSSRAPGPERQRGVPCGATPRCLPCCPLENPACR